MHFTAVHTVLNEEVPDVQMPGPFAAGRSAILFQQDRAHVVLIEHCILEIKTLAFQKISHPKKLWHYIMYSDHFALGRTLCDQFLHNQSTVDRTLAL